MKKEPSATVTRPKSPSPKVLLRWTYNGHHTDKKGREYVLRETILGGVLGNADSIEDMGGFGQCRVECVDDRGWLVVTVLDTMHVHYEQCISVPPEEVYLCGNGNMQMSLSTDVPVPSACI